jgi:hypothetical protein
MFCSAMQYKKLSQPASLKTGIQRGHVGGKTLRPDSYLPLYSDHRGSTDIPCFVPWAGPTAQRRAYPQHALAVT